jgi:hypothetical protein
MSKVRMKVTITGYYEVDPARYGDKKDNPAAIARIQEEYFSGDPLGALKSLEYGFTITVEPA